MNRKWSIYLIGSLVIGLIAGLAMTAIDAYHKRQGISSHARTDKQGETSSSTIDFSKVRQESPYLGLTREQMIDKAGIILVGKVTDISATSWNQDNGEPWYDQATGFGLQLHYVALDVVQPIVDTIGLGKQLTIVILGPSPLDGHSDDDLKVGDQAIFFAATTELAWREEQRRPIIELLTYPPDATFKLGDDNLYEGISLEEMINQIAQRRATFGSAVVRNVSRVFGHGRRKFSVGG